MYDDRLLQLNPNDVETLINKGVALSNKGNIDGAQKLYDLALERKKNYAKIYTKKGNALRNLYKFDEAIQMYDRALQINPNDAITYYNKGIALTNLGKIEEAKIMYDRAIRINPNHTQTFSNEVNLCDELKIFQMPCSMFEINNKSNTTWVVLNQENQNGFSKSKVILGYMI